MQAPRPMTRRQLEEHDRRHPPRPGERYHHVTDIGWLAVFGLAVVVLLCMGCFETFVGDTARLESGISFRGELCGVDLPDKPYVFWCKDYTGKRLDLEHPICTAACPANSSSDHECFDSTLNSSVFVADYATYQSFRYCVPSDKALESTVWFHKALGSEQVMQIASYLRRAWLVLAVDLVVSVLIGFAFLGLVGQGAQGVLAACIFLCIATPTFFGFYFIVKSHSYYHDGGDAFITNLYWGFALFGIAGLMGCFSACACSQLQKSLIFIESTSDCILSEPCIMAEPLVSLCIKVVLCLFMVFGLCTMLSTGEMSVARHDGVAYKVVEYSQEQWFGMGFWALMAAWLVEMTNAISQYVIARSTQIWYFTPYDVYTDVKYDLPPCCVCRAYSNVVRYHLGTMAAGGAVVGLLRIPRTIFNFMKFGAGSARGSPIRKFCGCCISGYTRLLQPYSKIAFFDVALTSSNFCTAARRATRMMQEEGGAAAALDGGQLIVMVAASGVSTMLGFAFTWLSCTKWSIYAHESSDTFIEDPRVVGAMGALLSFMVSMSFVVVFDTVGDTILYCYATEQCRLKAVDASRYSDHPEAEAQGWCFTGRPRPKKPEEPERYMYAPLKLRRALEEVGELERRPEAREPEVEAPQWF